MGWVGGETRYDPCPADDTDRRSWSARSGRAHECSVAATAATAPATRAGRSVRATAPGSGVGIVVCGAEGRGEGGG